MKKKLNPAALKELRKLKGLSHQALADRAGLVKSTIIELEKPSKKPSETMRAVQDRSYNALRRALGASDAQLRGEEPITDPMPANYVTLRSKITTVAQMNYDLISAQYGVESDQIVQLAPLMFAILVEDSFKWRREQLALCKQVMELQEKLRETVYAEHVSGPDTISPSDVLNHEEEAIDRREVFTAPLEATNALLRYENVIGASYFDSFEELREHHITDRFTDFIAEKLKSAPHACKADIPDIAPFSYRDILNPELRYISVPDLFDCVTEGDDEQATAELRLTLMTGAVRLQDADPDKINVPNGLKSWLTEQLRNPDTVSRRKEIAPAVLHRELGGADEAKVMGLDDHGFPVILEQGKKRSFAEVFATYSENEGDENASA